jgi:hypothetical protein
MSAFFGLPILMCDSSECLLSALRVAAARHAAAGTNVVEGLTAVVRRGRYDCQRRADRVLKDLRAPDATSLLGIYLEIEPSRSADLKWHRLWRNRNEPVDTVQRRR